MSYSSIYTGINKELIKVKIENYELKNKIKQLENYIDDLEYEIKYGHKKEKIRFVKVDKEK